MKKIFLTILCLFLIAVSNANEIDKAVLQSGHELKSTISIYAKNNDTNEVIYKKNENKLLVPASVLKLITFGSSYLTLGEDYKFETSLYKDSKDNYYLKLSGDPLLSKNDLIKLFTNSKIKKINSIYIDDTLFDKTPYPPGWMEEDTWPYQRAITPYIIDNNMFEIEIKRSSLATKVDIIQAGSYRLPVINKLELGDVQNYKIERQYGQNSPIITLTGTIAKDESFSLPVLNPEINFNIKLTEAIKEAGLSNIKKITPKKVPADAKKVISISHSIDEVSRNILVYSDNLSSEVVFKAAAAKYIGYKRPATLDDAIAMVKSTFNTDEDIAITDGSGVSRNNFVSTSYVVDCLQKLLKQEKFKNLLATPNEGTLKDRLLFLENNLWAKTGTLEGSSSIAGIMTTQSGKNVVFAMIVQNSPKRKAVLKNFENNIITILYRKY